MARGKKSKVKADVKRKKEAEDNSFLKQKNVGDTDETKENIRTYLKPKEIEELQAIIQRKDVDDMAVLTAASVLGHVDLVRKFLKDGSRVDVTDKELMTPYLWSVKHKQDEVTDLLIRYGANITATDINGNNSLLIAAESLIWDEEAIVQHYNKIKDKIDVKHKNESGNTALHYAVRRHWVKLCASLVTARCDVNSTNRKGVTCLMLAACKGYEDLINFFLQNNADLLIEDERGCTALCYAIAKHQPKKGEQCSSTWMKLLSVLRNTNMEKYLMRRLQLLMNITKCNESNITQKYLRPVVSYFVKYVPNGLTILIKTKVFDSVFQALKNHIAQVDRLISTLEVLSETLNYCDCCVKPANPNLSIQHVYQTFFSSKCPKMCLVILKNNGLSNIKNVGNAVFLPLYLTCSQSLTGRIWLQDNWTAIQPYYKKLMEGTRDDDGEFADEVHSKTINKYIKAFHSLANRLIKSETIVSKDEKPTGEELSSQEKDGSLTCVSLMSRKGRRKAKSKKAKKRASDVGEALKIGVEDNAINEEKLVRSNKTEIEAPQVEENVCYVNEKLIFSDEDSYFEIPVKKIKDFSRSSTEQLSVGYNPSDLFGVLATTSSCSVEEKDAKEIPVLESEPDDQGKVEGNYALVSFKEESKEYPLLLTSRQSEERVSRKRNDVSLQYVEHLFHDFVNKFKKIWEYEKQKNYPGHKTPENEDDSVYVMKLKLTLDQLEDHFLGALKGEWSLLIESLRHKTWKDEDQAMSVIYQIQDLLAKYEGNMLKKLRLIETEETRLRYLEKKYHTVNRKHGEGQTPKKKQRTVPTEVETDVNKERGSCRNSTVDCRMPEENVQIINISQEQDLLSEVNTIYFNKGFKSDSEIVSLSSMTASSHSMISPRTDEEKMTKKTHNEHKDIVSTSCYTKDIENLKKMLANSHVQYGGFLLPNPLKSGRILLPFGESGYFGAVEIGLDHRGHAVAVKHIKKSSTTSVNNLCNIIKHLKKINHRFLLPYFLSEGPEPILATHLMDYNLGQYILHLKTNNMLEAKSFQIIRELSEGMYFLHVRKSPIIHGNLKPSNVFIDSKGQVKIAEFGISSALYMKKLNTPCSMIWWPGEVIMSYKELNKLKFSLSADVATTGMMIHYILSGGQHAYGKQVQEIVDNLTTGKWVLITRDPDAVDLISWMLAFQPDKRPSIQAMVKHVYFWSSEKKWDFILTCSGVSSIQEHSILIHDLHYFLEIKAEEYHIQGDWKAIVTVYFPNCSKNINRYKSSIVGLLLFIKASVEEKRKIPCWMSGAVEFKRNLHDNCMDHIPTFCDIQSFTLTVFTALALSLYRILEYSPWMNSPLLSRFNDMS